MSDAKDIANLDHDSHEKFDTTSLGRRIKFYRKDRKMTSAVLSEKIGKSGGSYVRIVESGAGGVSMEAFIDICNALEINPQYLLEEYLDFEPDKQENHPLLDMYHKLSNEYKDILYRVAEILIKKSKS